MRVWFAGGIRSRKKQAGDCSTWTRRQICGEAAVSLNLDEALQRMDGQSTSSYRYVYLLRQCGNQLALEEGKKVHDQIRRNGFEGERFLGNLLIEMYTKCGSLEDARKAFEAIKERNAFSFALIISAYEKNSAEVYYLFWRMMLEGLKPDKAILASLVSSCGSLQAAKAVHACVLESDLEEDFGNAIVSTYLKFGGLQQAKVVFEGLQSKGLFAWTALIGACAQQGKNKDALKLYHSLDLEGVKPDVVTYINSIKACTNSEDLAAGRRIHHRLISEGLDSDVIAGNALVNMYSKCGFLDEARGVFDGSSKNETSWNTIISAYAREELSKDAIILYQLMMLDGTKPNDVTFIGLVGVCGKDYAEQIHDCVIACGLETTLVVGTALVTMYGRSGNLAAADRVFGKLEWKNVITWNTIIGAYAEHGEPLEALKFQQRMELEGVKQNRVTFLILLDVCSDLESCEDGEAVYARYTSMGFGSDPVLDSAVVNMYTKCKSLALAKLVFDGMATRSAITWTTLIAAYAQQGQGKEALQLFRSMDLAGIKPDEVTYVNVLGACCSVGVRSDAEALQLRIAASGIHSGVLKNNLVNLYSKLGKLADAQKVFEEMDLRDICSCTTMISAYAQHGRERKALELYQKMDLEGLKPDNVTHISVLDACSRIDAVKAGKLIHERVLSSGSASDVFVGTALVNMYGKCGDLVNAQTVFDKLPIKTAVTWNALLSAYLQRGYSEEAFELYQKLETTGEVEPDELTYVVVIGACCDMGSLIKGRPVHEKLRNSGLESGAIVSTALINMYGKCGSLEEAREIFDKSCLWNVVSWNAMIVAYAQNGEEKQGLELYQLMNLEGVEPNGVTYTGVLFACGHGGMLEEACKQFVSLKMDRGIEWEDEHYSCMIDLMGRVGRLEEAEEFIRVVPKAGAAAWLALLNACQMHGDLDRGKWVCREAIERNPQTSSSYVLLSNIYMQ